MKVFKERKQPQPTQGVRLEGKEYDEGCDRLVWDNAHQLDYTLKIEKGVVFKGPCMAVTLAALLVGPQSFLEVWQ